MSTARRVIDWHKQSAEELARELNDLPEGRYVLVPENELVDEASLSAEDEEAIEAGLDAVDRGDTTPWGSVRDNARAAIAAARAARGR